MKKISFLDHLKAKRNLLIIWFCVHGFALFVNIFGIQGNLDGSDDATTHDYSKEDVSVNLFTTSPTHGFHVENEFWPIVSYTERYNTLRITQFKGIFYK